MKKRFVLCVVSAAVVGYVVGRTSGSTAAPVVGGHFSDLSFIEPGFAQDNKPEVMPFGFNSPRLPAQAPDAPPITHWSINDMEKAHADMAEKAAKLISHPGSGSSQAFVGGPIDLQTRNFSMYMLYRIHREQPVLSLTKINSVWDDAEQHAGVYDFYVFTGGTGQMIVGGRIENRKNLTDKDGPVPGEYRGQPIVGGQTFNVKAGDWLLIPPDQPHQPQPAPGGFSYMIMKINTGIYPWSLIR
jgi:mannose-6-phosphate isomerase-like protein (cupin superfamily)